MFGCLGDVSCGSSTPPAGFALQKWLCPQLDTLRKLLARCGMGGRVSREGRHGLGRRPPTLVSGHRESSGLLEKKLAPLCGLKEVE